MTIPTGRSFLSYRRSRFNEARALILHQHDLGIPTWQDIEDLDDEPTEEAIRSVLSDAHIANAVMWLTPDVAASSVIRRVEVPLILDRHGRADGFFVVPVVAGGLDYQGVGTLLQGDIGIEDLSRWNVRKISTDPASEQEIRTIAVRTLSRRLQAVHNYLPHGEPLSLVLNTRGRFPSESTTALAIDWTHRFEGRIATGVTWRDHLLPALADISAQVQERAPGRAVQASGLLSIPAATALGYFFMAPMRIQLSWEQFTPGRPPQMWSLQDSRKDSGFEAVIHAGDTGADDLAVLVSVNADVSLAVGDSHQSLPRFRACVHVKPQSTPGTAELRSGGEAVDVARHVVEASRNARRAYHVRGRVHLFMAVPVGLAMLVGQLLNTLGQVQTYEHIPDGATGHYVAAGLLGN